MSDGTFCHVEAHIFTGFHAHFHNGCEEQEIGYKLAITSLPCSVCTENPYHIPNCFFEYVFEVWLIYHCFLGTCFWLLSADI